MQIAARMRCVSVTPTGYGTAQRVILSAVRAEEIPAESRFYEDACSGTLELIVTKDDVKFEKGKHYYIDISESAVETIAGPAISANVPSVPTTLN